MTTNFPSAAEQTPDDVKPTVSEIVAHHVDADLITVKQVTTALHLCQSDGYRLVSGRWDARFALHNTMLRRFPRPLADDLATYFFRGTGYGWVPVPAGLDARQCDALAELAGLQRSAARLLELVQAQIREGLITNQRFAEAIAAANAIKRAADGVTEGLARLAG